MGSSITRQILLAASAGLVAVAWQYIISPTLFTTYGYFRTVQPVSDFPYICRRLTDPALHSCEDMWLNAATRTLYLACSDVSARKHWEPNIGRLDASKRSKNDHVVSLKLDSGPDYTFAKLRTSGYANVMQQPELHLVGLSGHHIHSTGLTYLYLINNSPSFTSTNGYTTDNVDEFLLSNAITGANSTIEVFATSALSDSLEHIRTFSHQQIATPNNVAYHPQSGGIYITNDHGTHKAGIGHTLSTMIGTGDVSYCSASEPTECKKVAGGFKFPNGLHLSPTDGFLYVPSAVDGNIHVYKPLIKYPHSDDDHGSHGHSHSPDDAPFYDGDIQLVTTIKTGYPIDNISEDQEGNIFAAALPNLGMIAAFDDPTYRAASTGLKITRGKFVSTDEKGKKVDGHYQYHLEKIIEDKDGEVLPASTTVIRDAVTGRLWLSSIVSDFVTVCDPK